jgi:hypothetical protein
MMSAIFGGCAYKIYGDKIVAKCYALGFISAAGP